MNKRFVFGQTEALATEVIELNLIKPVTCTMQLSQTDVYSVLYRLLLSGSRPVCVVAEKPDYCTIRYQVMKKDE